MQGFVVQVTKLKAHETASWLQHSVRFLENTINVRAIPDAKSDCVRSERIVVERQLFGIGTDPVHRNRIRVRICVAQLVGSSFTDVQHVLIYVADGDMTFANRIVVAIRGRQVVDVVYVAKSDVT